MGGGGQTHRHMNIATVTHSPKTTLCHHNCLASICVVISQQDSEVSTREFVAGVCRGSIARHCTPDVAQLGLTGTSPLLWRDPPSVTIILLVISAYICVIDHLAQDT